MSEAERVSPEALAIAGYVAPRLRSQPEAVRMRRIGRLDKDGNVVGYTTLGDAQKALLKRQEIEFDVADREKSKYIKCRLCGILSRRPKGGGRANLCSLCSVPKCGRCGVNVERKRLTPSKLKRTKGAVRCFACFKAQVKPRPTCIDCGKLLSASASQKKTKRCWQCNGVANRKVHPPKPKCVDCGKQLSDMRSQRCLLHAGAERRRRQEDRKAPQ